MICTQLTQAVRSAEDDEVAAEDVRCSHMKLECMNVRWQPCLVQQGSYMGAGPPESAAVAAQKEMARAMVRTIVRGRCYMD